MAIRRPGERGPSQPVRDAPIRDRPTHVTPVHEDSRENPRCARRRVLIVDDERLVRHSLSRVLGEAYEVVAMSTARLALELLEVDRQFDVILCDLHMPTMTGQQLHAELRERAPECAGKVVFMSGEGDALPDGLVDGRPGRFLLKPFNLSTLLALVAEHTNSRSPT